jgi:hypothetical protein
MGILDDAIREHLNLKRRRGADPAEVEQAEREALGPVRRGPEPAADEELEPRKENGTAAAAPEPEPEFPDDLGWDEPAAAEAEPHEPDDTATAGQTAEGEAPFDAEVEASPVPAKPPPERPIAPDPGGEPTAEYDVEKALEEEPKGEGEDVLEETPEFLQDAPDHDRLWFEQKPPRDFDFDK